MAVATLICLLTVWPVVLAVQTPSASPARDAANVELEHGTAVVRGRVTDAETGAPLPRVTISLLLAETRAQVDTTTDATGAFEFTRVAAGAYTLTADPVGRTTHGPSRYIVPAERSAGKRSTLVLHEGQVFDKADIALPRRYAIAARVVDEHGEPVPDMLVRAEAIDGPAVPARARTTDDRGAVRLWGFPAGRYRVCAIPNPSPAVGAAEGYVRTCHPSATADAEAQPLVVTTVDTPEVEIRLGHSRLFRIAGFVVDGSGNVAPEARVSFVSIEDNSSSSRSVEARGGAFSIEGIAPGQYFVTADLDLSNAASPMRQSGYAPVHIQSTDVENLAVVMSPPATVRGRLIFDGAPPPRMTGVTVRAVPASNSIAVLRGVVESASRVRTNLTFELKGLFGPYTVHVHGLRGWIAKSLRYRGEERLEMPTEFKGSSDGADLEIVMTNRPAQLLARAFDSNGKPVEEARIVLFPADSRLWELVEVVRRGTPRDGVQVFGNLRPATYVVGVVPDGMGAVNNRRSLEELAKEGERITLVEGDQRTIDLVVR